MQKKFIALAVAGLVSGAAFAQSNVTIYGTADVTFDNVDATKEAAGTFERSNRVSANSSFLGFKGAEALGNGLNAVFQFEAAVANDSAGAVSFNRDTFVGLSSSSWGTVVAGTLTGPTRALGASMDVFAGATGIGANTGLIGKLGNNTTNLTTDAIGNAGAAAATRSQTQTSTFDTRWKNAIAYVSPSFAGLTATAAYVANENHSTTANTSGYDVGLNYGNGPIKAGITYNAVTLKNDVALTGTTYGGVAAAALGTTVKTNDLRVGASYDFGVASIRALYDRVKLESSTVDLKQNVWGLGGTFNVSSAGKIVGQFYKAQDVKGLAGDQAARLWAVGYEHSLSKRTILKATYANLNNGNDVNYDFGINATGGAVNNSTVSGFQFGMRHSF